MPSVYLYEPAEIERKLMSYAIDQANPNALRASPSSWEEAKAFFSLPIHRGSQVFDLVMLNFDKDLPEDNLERIISLVRSQETFRYAYLIVWIPPLEQVPGWLPSFGRGSFEKKPFEFERLVQLIQDRWQEDRVKGMNG